MKTLPDNTVSSSYSAINRSWVSLRNVHELHIELTNVCNLHCSYCYAEVETPGKEVPLFDIDSFAIAIERIAEYSRKSHIELIFHGGEPLLQRAQWYDEACTLAVKIMGDKGKTVDFGLQSNLTLLNDEHIDVFARHGVKIGTSIDGPEDVHNQVRGGFKKTIHNLKRLRSRGIFSGAIAVIHLHNWTLVPQIYETFYQLGITAFHLNIASAVGHGTGATPLTEEQIFRVLKDNLDSLIRYEGAIVETRMLAKIQRHLAAPSAKEFLAQLRCDNPFCHAGINMIVVKKTGEIYPCGCAGSSGNVQNYLLGNILDPDGFNPDWWKQKLHGFHGKTDKYEKECRTCPARFVCEHGCPAFDLSDPETPENHCGATKRFERYLRTLPLEAIEQVAQMNPQMAKSKRAADIITNWQ